MSPSLRIAGCVAACLLAVSTATGDIVTLEGGGTVRGRITSPPGSPVVTIESMIGTEYRFERGEIKALSRRSILVERYVSAARKIENSGDSTEHQNLACWARTNRLRTQANEQLRKVIEIDPDNDAARKQLGYKWVEGRWQTEDDIKAAAGLVNVNGRWMPQRAKDLLDEGKQRKLNANRWFAELRPVALAAASFDNRRRGEALNTISRIDDPAATRAVQTLFAKNPSRDIRLAAIDAFENIGGRTPVPALVAIAVLDIDDEIRREAALALDPVASTESIRELAKHLRATENTSVQRAADALRTVADERATPFLIDALITSHRISIQVPDRTPSFGVGGGQIGAAGPTQLSPELEAMLRTGQLEPGVHLPKPRMVTKRVRRDIRNTPVLQALVQLTGQNFGFDKAAWRRWLLETKKANAGKKL